MDIAGITATPKSIVHVYVTLLRVTEKSAGLGMRLHFNHKAKETIKWARPGDKTTPSQASSQSRHTSLQMQTSLNSTNGSRSSVLSSSVGREEVVGVAKSGSFFFSCFPLGRVGGGTMAGVSEGSSSNSSRF